jgi:hypothetical protein
MCFTSPTRSANGALLGVLSAVPLAPTMNGVPLKAPNTPLSCQSAMTAFAALS